MPLISTEQHAYLTLGMYSVLSERVAVEAAGPLEAPVFPAVAYGGHSQLSQLSGDQFAARRNLHAHRAHLLDGLEGGDFRRVVLVNGHGGNSTVEALAIDWMADHTHVQLKFPNWWNAPRTLAKLQEVDPLGRHASWMENFPWTRVVGVQPPDERKPAPDRLGMARPVGQRIRDVIGDGNFGGYYERDDAEMLAIWETAVAETRELIVEGWD